MHKKSIAVLYKQKKNAMAEANAITVPEEKRYSELVEEAKADGMSLPTRGANGNDEVTFKDDVLKWLRSKDVPLWKKTVTWNEVDVAVVQRTNSENGEKTSGKIRGKTVHGIVFKDIIKGINYKRCSCGNKAVLLNNNCYEISRCARRAGGDRVDVKYMSAGYFHKASGIPTEFRDIDDATRSLFLDRGQVCNEHAKEGAEIMIINWDEAVKVVCPENQKTSDRNSVDMLREANNAVTQHVARSKLTTQENAQLNSVIEYYEAAVSDLQARLKLRMDEVAAAAVELGQLQKSLEGDATAS